MAKTYQETLAEIPETQDDGVVPVAADKMLAATLKEESFANEIIKIVVHESAKEDDPVCFMVNVNGVNQPIVRGMEQDIKRKYVEALARAKTTLYTQRTPNPSEPDRIENIPRTALSYPFSVLHDPNPNGRRWLHNVLHER